MQGILIIMGKTFKDGASAKYKRHLIDDKDLSIEFVLGKKKQNLKKARYNKSKEVVKIETDDE